MSTHTCKCRSADAAGGLKQLSRAVLQACRRVSEQRTLLQTIGLVGLVSLLLGPGLGRSSLGLGPRLAEQAERRRKPGRAGLRWSAKHAETQKHEEQTR